MKKLVLGMIASALSFNAMAIDTSKLVKVTGDGNQKCVEYYTYQGESYCSETALTAEESGKPVNEKDPQKIKFDDRPWKAVWSSKTNHSITIEYLPAGDKITDWKELVTSQFYTGLQERVTPEIFMEGEMAGLKEKKFNPIVTVIKKAPDMILFEFRITEPTEQTQDELQKIMKGPNGIYILHYVIRKADMGEEKRKEWTTNLLESSIAES